MAGAAGGAAPLRLRLGSGAWPRVTTAVQDRLDAWRNQRGVALSTDFTRAEPHGRGRRRRGPVLRPPSAPAMAMRPSARQGASFEPTRRLLDACLDSPPPSRAILLSRRRLATPPIPTAFERAPDRDRGLARDMRGRWAFEELGQPCDAPLASCAGMKEPAHRALHPFGQIPTYPDPDL